METLRCQPDEGIKLSGMIVRGPRMSGQDFMAIHPIFVSIFWPRPKWWTDPTTISVINISLTRTALGLGQFVPSGSSTADPDL